MNNIQTQQERHLISLLQKAGATAIGKEYDFASIESYREYAERVPIHTYDHLKSYVDRIKAGEQDVLWPGNIRNFAVSSGTTGKGKHLPLSNERLSSDLRFMRMVVRHHLSRYPDPGLFTGPHLSLPGTVERSNDSSQLNFGEISGFLGMRSPRWLRLLQVADPVELSKMSWNEKFQRAIQNSIKKDLRVISAVPSWILILFREVLKQTGKTSIADVWPNLKLLVCGGVSLANYRRTLIHHCEGLPLHFIENYGASEGYFSFGDITQSLDMKLVTDNGVFFEFREKTDDSNGFIIPLWEVRPDTEYEMIVSTNSGLWRYPINDIISFTQTDPYRIRICGRVSNILDRYGEALHYREARSVLNEFCKNTNTLYRHLFITALPPGDNSSPRHKWYIDWQKAPAFVNGDKMAQIIDHALCKINRHYDIRRQTMALGAPIISNIDGQKLMSWLSDKVLDRAQTKMPTVIEDDTLVADLDQMTIPG